MPRIFSLVLLGCALAEGTTFSQSSGRTNWPSFRGHNGNGEEAGFAAPVKWDAPKWKTPVPGLAHSSPVIWGNRVFVTTAVTAKGDESLKVGLYGSIQPVEEQGEYAWQVICLDKKDGRVLCKQTAREGIPRIKRHPKASHANSTPATDGKHVAAFFGAEGLHCYDMEGNLSWRKDFANIDSGYFMVPSAQWGFGNSPILHDGRVIIQCDVQTNSFIAAYDATDGKEIWRTARTDVPTWSTPGIHIGPERSQVVVNGFRHSGGYDLQTGKELWKLGGAGDIPVPTPVFGHDLIFLTSAHGRLSPIYAVRPTATGDISLKRGESTNEFIAWSIPRGGNYMQTPILVGDYLFACGDHGVATCYDAKTGARQFSERLGPGNAGFTASPVAADGKIYYTNEEGLVYVIKAAPQFEVLATNKLGETCMATPAISAGELFFRTRHHLICVAP